MLDTNFYHMSQAETPFMRNSPKAATGLVAAQAALKVATVARARRSGRQELNALCTGCERARFCNSCPGSAAAVADHAKVCTASVKHTTRAAAKRN